MTYRQAIELAEIEAAVAAERAFERFLEAFENDEHPEIISQLENEAAIAKHHHDEIIDEDLAH